MKVLPKNRVKFLQEGGPMPEDPAMAGGEAPMEEAPMEEGAPAGGDPLMQLAQMAAQALQSQDCNMAMQVCQAFMQLIQQAQGGGGAPAEPQGEPVFKRGGKIAYRIRK